MKISLRRASQLELAIQDRVRSISSRINPSTQLSIHASVLSRRNEARQKLADLVNQIDQLESARYAIRQAISDANTAAGVSQCLTKIKHRKDRIERIAPLANAGVAMTDNELETEMKAKRERYRKGADGYSDETIHAGLLSEEDVQVYLIDFHAMQREVNSLQDELASLNNTTTIEIPEEDIEIISAEGLI